MHDLDRAEQETLFLEWVQGLVGKDIVWAEITGSNTGRSCRMQAGYLRSVEAGEPGIPYPCGPEDNHQVPTLRLTLDAAVISAWANGKQDYDGDHLYWYSEIGRDERGGVDLDGQFEWYAFGDWLKEDKGIYWSSSYVPDTSWPVSVA